ncbi:hypothetical protein [Candidatus Uabimicrobium sp. HlEnr_7]|uniref:hypothetical protein n=1 Tax=Candidatus Uabimicrobium helgolandensis TaxID=3095367 RepID=UPI0035585866
MKYLYLCFFSLVFLSAETLLPIQVRCQVMPSKEKVTSILEKFESHIEKENTNIPYFVFNKTSKNVENSFPVYRNIDAEKIEESAYSLYALDNERFIEALLVNGYHIQIYINLPGVEQKILNCTMVTLVGYDRDQQIFSAVNSSKKNIDLSYSIVTENGVFAELGNEPIARKWEIELVGSDLETRAQVFSQKDKPVSLSTALKTVATSQKITERGGSFCIISLAADTARRPKFVNINFECYMYKYKRGKTDKLGYVIRFPGRTQVKYDYIQPLRIIISRTMCSGYIGNQYDRCNGFSSTLIPHVGLATQYNPDAKILSTNVISFYRCNVRNFSFETSKFPAIVRGKVECAN